jgi:Flp pilus assembly protein TadD
MSTINVLKKYERYFTVILFVISTLLYANTLTHGFVLDDEAVIVKNKFVQKGWAGIPEIFTTFYWQGYWDLNSGLYRPLSLVMFAIEWAISPDNPLIHHLIQVMLYGGCIVVFYCFLLKLLKEYSPVLTFIIALLFAVHPVHTEVVANIKSRDELLCFFFLALLANSLITHQKATISGLIFFQLALLSKEAAIMYIPILAIMLVQFRGVNWGKLVKILAPYIAVLIVWLGWRWYILSKAPVRVHYTYADNSILACGGKIEQLMTAISIIGRYMVKIILPIQLSYDYSYNEIPCADATSGYFLFAAISIATLIFVAVKYFKTNPVISFGILFFFITMALTSNLFYTIGTTMGERLMFTPIAGAILAIVFCVSGKVKHAKGLIISPIVINISLVVAGIFSLMTVNRNKAWASNLTLFETDIIHAPGSARVHYNYGSALLNLPLQPDYSTQYADALEQLEQAYAIDPKDYNTKVNLGVALYKNENYKRAITVFREAIKQSPNDYLVAVNLGDVYMKMKMWDSASIYYQSALDHNVYQTNTHNWYGLALFSLKNYAHASEVYASGLKIYSDNAELWLNYGNTLGVQGEFEKAITAFQKAYALDNTNKQALYFIALTYSNMGDKQKAEEYLAFYSKK